MARPQLGATTAPTTAAFGDAPSAGTAGANTALGDHRHGMPAAPATHAQAHDHTAADGSGVLTNDVHDGYSEYGEIAIPAAPAADKLRMFVVDSDGHSVLGVIDSTGLATTPFRDAFLIAKVDEAGGVTAGQALYLSGSSGTNELVKKARANSATTMPAVGLAVQSGAFNAFIKVLLLGKVTNIDTSAWAAGASLYVSAATAGVLTTTPPSAPDRVQRIAFVTRSHATLGELLLTAEAEIIQVAHASLSGITATDHHAAPAAGPDANVTVDAAGAAGTASTFARSAHGHQVVTSAAAGAVITVDGIPGTRATGAIARAGHGHQIGTSNVTPAATATAGAPGTSGTAPSRGDHVHAHGTFASGDLHQEYVTESAHGGVSPSGHHAQSHDHSAAGDGTTLIPGFLRLPPRSGVYSDPATNEIVFVNGASLRVSDTPTHSVEFLPSDTTAPTTQAFGDAADAGVATYKAARIGHKHAMPADPVTAHAAAGDPHPAYVLDTDLAAHRVFLYANFT